jgi:hypothetical protein
MLKILAFVITCVLASIAHAENEWQFNLPIDRIVTTSSNSFLIINNTSLYPTCNRGGSTGLPWGGQGPFGVIQIPNKETLSLLLSAKAQGQSLRFAVVSLNAGSFDAPGMGSTSCQIKYSEVQ